MTRTRRRGEDGEGRRRGEERKETRGAVSSKRGPNTTGWLGMNFKRIMETSREFCARKFSGNRAIPIIPRKNQYKMIMRGYVKWILSKSATPVEENAIFFSKIFVETLLSATCRILRKKQYKMIIRGSVKWILSELYETSCEFCAQKFSGNRAIPIIPRKNQYKMIMRGYVKWVLSKSATQFREKRRFCFTTFCWNPVVGNLQNPSQKPIWNDHSRIFDMSFKPIIRDILRICCTGSLRRSDVFAYSHICPGICPKNVTNCCVSLMCIICLINHMDYIQQMHVSEICPKNVTNCFANFAGHMRASSRRYVPMLQCSSHGRPHATKWSVRTS